MRQCAVVDVDRAAAQLDLGALPLAMVMPGSRDLDLRAAGGLDQDAAAGRVADHQAVAAGRLQRDAADARASRCAQRRRLAARRSSRPARPDSPRRRARTAPTRPHPMGGTVNMPMLVPVTGRQGMRPARDRSLPPTSATETWMRAMFCGSMLFSTRAGIDAVEALVAHVGTTGSGGEQAVARQRERLLVGAALDVVRHVLARSRGRRRAGPRRARPRASAT